MTAWLNPATLLFVSLMLNANAKTRCIPFGTIDQQTVVDHLPVIQSVGDATSLVSCVSFNETADSVTHFSIGFSRRFVDTLPGYPLASPDSVPLGEMPDTVDGLLLSDLKVCNFKFGPSVQTCAKGYRAFGELPLETITSPFHLVMLSWDTLGLYRGHPGLNEPLLGFHFYFNMDYHEIVGIHPGWSDDQVHVEENSNAIVQRPLDPSLIPENYISTGEEGARASVGGILINQAPDSLSPNIESELLWGYYDSRQVFIRPTFTVSELKKVAGKCRSPDDGLLMPDDQGSGDMLEPERHCIFHYCWPISQPEAYKIAGRYPHTYCLEYDNQAAREFSVSLTDFTDSGNPLTPPLLPSANVHSKANLVMTTITLVASLLVARELTLF